jgi:hypothetical protein
MKTDMNMLPPRTIRLLADIFTACAKGRPHWWIEQTSQIDDLSAALRHINAHQQGKWYSEEGYWHLAHAACRLIMVVEKILAHGPEVSVWNHLNIPDPQSDSLENNGEPPEPSPDAESAGGGGQKRKLTHEAERVEDVCARCHRYVGEQHRCNVWGD